MTIDIKSIVMGLVFALMWSSAFATARIIVADAPPLTVLSARFFLSGMIAVIAARAMGQSWRLAPAQARSVLLFGFCQNALYLGLNFAALQHIEASLASIIASSMPLIVAALGWVIFGQRVAGLGIAGLIAGFSGVSLIMGSRVSAGADLQSVAYCVAGATALGVATLTVRSASSGGNLLMVVGLQMLVGSLILAICAAVFETIEIRFNTSLILAFLYQTFVPGLAATLIWFHLVGRIGAVKASAFHFLNPFFGVLIASLLLGEHISRLDMAGVAIAALGILAVQLSKMRSV